MRSFRTFPLRNKACFIIRKWTYFRRIRALLQKPKTPLWSPTFCSSNVNFPHRPPSFSHFRRWSFKLGSCRIRGCTPGVLARGQAATLPIWPPKSPPYLIGPNHPLLEDPPRAAAWQRPLRRIKQCLQTVNVMFGQGLKASPKSCRRKTPLILVVPMLGDRMEQRLFVDDTGTLSVCQCQFHTIHF